MSEKSYVPCKREGNDRDEHPGDKTTPGTPLIALYDGFLKFDAVFLLTLGHSNDTVGGTFHGIVVFRENFWRWNWSLE